MANAQTLLGEIEDSIECSICTHRFREPKWLNCFHTFCLQCLQEICKNQGPRCKKLPCPLCRQETILTNGTVSDLLDNTEMKALIAAFTQQENVVKQQFEQLEDFPKLVAKGRRSKTEFELLVKNLDTFLENLDKVFCDTKEKISKKAIKEVFRIRDEEQRLIKEAENIHKNKVEVLKSLQASARREASQTACILHEVNQLVSGGSNGNKGQDYKKRIFKDLEKATKKHPQSVPDGLTFMDFEENAEGSLGELVHNDDDFLQQSIDDDIQLGPGPRSFGGWTRGSSGGSSKTVTQSESQEPKQSNRFMMLPDDRKGRVPESKGRGPQSLQGKRSSSSRERDEMSKERRSAIAEVQKIISQARRSQSREKELDSRGSRGKQEPALVSAPVKEVTRASVPPAISEDAFEKKAMATIKEYLSNKDIERADVVGEMRQPSGITWDMFLPSGKDVQEFGNNKKLGFTLSTGTSTTTNSGGDANANNLSDEELVSHIKRELGSILATNDNVNDKVFDWIQKNLNISSPEKQRLFIRALVTVVVQSTIQGDKAESCRMNHDVLNVRTAILKRYINNDNNLELQALYAVQALNQHLESPPGLLYNIFYELYNEVVIPGETFYAWQKSSDPNESNGKGVALKSVQSLFDWLALGEPEEEPAE